MMRQLQHRGYRPLVVLHCRHTMPGVIPRDHLPIVDKWREEKLLLTTPHGCNDDWFWLYAAVKLRCKVVTNDEMRDHHFQMLHAR